MGWGEARGGGEDDLRLALADDLAAAVWRWKLRPSVRNQFAAEAALDAYMAARWGGVPQHFVKGQPDG